MFDFVRIRPQDFLFLDYVSAAKILSPEQQAITDKYAADIAVLLKRGVDDGTLADLDTSLLSLLLVAPIAMFLLFLHSSILCLHDPCAPPNQVPMIHVPK